MGEGLLVRRGGGGSSDEAAYWWAKYTTDKVFIGYVGSDDIDEYPEAGEQDGYYYELQKKTIEGLTWAEINTLASSGIVKKLLSVGDRKSITLTTNEIIYVKIADFNHDTLSDNTTAPITFIMEDCFKTTYQMNSSNTNSGGWKSALLRTTLNSTIYNTFPSDLKAVMKTTRKKRYNGGGSVSTLNTVDDKLWLPSEMELFGSASCTGGYAEGTLYPIYTDNTSRIKKVNGSANWYWTSSACGSNAYSFVCVYNYGDVGNHNANNYFGVSAGFCI